MATVDRTTILQEPGLLQFGSQTFYSAGPIVVDLLETYFDVPSDQFGVVDRRPDDRRIEIKFTPVGEIEALAVLFPMGGLALGTSLFGATDSAAVIYTPSGKSFTAHNCAVTSQPDFIAAHNATAFGEVTITGLIKNDVAPDAANAYFTYVAADATYPGDAQFSAAAIKTLGYKGAWGSSPWDDFATETGFTLTTSPTLSEVRADGFGTVDIRLGSLDASISGIPIGITHADITSKISYQGSGNQLGATRADGTDLVVTNNVGATAVHLQLYGATLDPASLNFSGSERGVGELTWRATREFDTGVASPLFYVGTSAPA